MLLMGAWLIKHKLDIAPGVKKFMDLLILGGVGSMVVGVALGGYFAIPIEYLPQALQDAQVLNPIEDVQTFLLFALALGLVQVFFGIVLAAWHAFRRGDALSAVSDHLSIIFLFLMLAGSFVAGFAGNTALLRASLVLGIVGTMILQGRAVQAALSVEGATQRDRWLGSVWVGVFVGGLFAYAFTGALYALWAMLGVCLLAIVSRSVRAAVIAVLLGAYNVYGLTGVVGDVLSYLRLAALGLSSTLVGWVFNILTELVWTSAEPLFAAGGLSWLLGALIALAAVLVFSVGHVFNVVINLLGAFVHPARLQFVEFFSKFYEAGGRNFAPFRFKTEGLVLEAGAAGEERGKVS
jgi:V/A-type H+-transporting ATPase subunit I